MALATLKKTHIVMQKIFFSSFFSNHSGVTLHQCRIIKYYNHGYYTARNYDV